MKKLFFCMLISGTFFTLTSCDNNPGAVEQANEKNEEKFVDDKKEDDREFVVEASSEGMMMVETSKIATTKASMKSVKNFAQMMVDAHTKGCDDLKAMAKKKNITVPSVPGDGEQKDIKDFMEKTKDFDKDYMKFMVNEHEDMISKFEKEMNDGKDADVRAYATNMLTGLRKHHEEAKAILKGIK